MHLNVEPLNNFDDVVFEDDIDLCDIPMFFDQSSVNFADICSLPSEAGTNTSLSSLVNVDESALVGPEKEITSDQVDITELPLVDPEQETASNSVNVHVDLSPEIQALDKLTDTVFESVSSVSSETSTPINNSDMISSLFRKIVVKYFMCRTKHFIKGLKNETEVEKAKAHRKKIEQKGEKTEAKRSKLTIADIVKDNSEGKQVSLRIIVGNITKMPITTLQKMPIT